ncbi:MAG: DUF1579 domain-containing protein [Planctomycetales bacterium]|nr:DUF1579 domain-containing protein [Planctomycetales bacterium]
MPPATPEAKWLEQFVGEWETTGTATTTPGAEPFTCQGTMSCKSLGGYWVVSELVSKTTDKPVTAVQQIGYDPAAKQYVGTWIDSTNSHLWKYQGSKDKSGNVLTLEAAGPNFLGDGKPALFRDVYDFSDPGRMKLSSFMQGESGEWIPFMTSTAVRKE